MKFLKKIASKEEAVTQEYNVLYATDTEVMIMKAAPKLDFTFGTVESHTKVKADAVVGDICYWDETPIGVVVIKNADSVKIMSLFDLNENGTDSPTRHPNLIWCASSTATNATDVNDGKANTEALVALGSEYKAATACYLYSTEGTKQGDWYLPAKQEITDMQWNTNIEIIQSSLNILGSFALSLNDSQYHWTSTEVNEWWTYSFTPKSGSTNNSSKSYSLIVRAFCEL